MTWQPTPEEASARTVTRRTALFRHVGDLPAPIEIKAEGLAGLAEAAVSISDLGKLPRGFILGTKMVLEEPEREVESPAWMFPKKDNFAVYRAREGTVVVTDEQVTRFLETHKDREQLFVVAIYTGEGRVDTPFPQNSGLTWIEHEYLHARLAALANSRLDQTEAPLPIPQPEIDPANMILKFEKLALSAPSTQEAAHDQVAAVFKHLNSIANAYVKYKARMRLLADDKKWLHVVFEDDAEFSPAFQHVKEVQKLGLNNLGRDIGMPDPRNSTEYKNALRESTFCFLLGGWFEEFERLGIFLDSGVPAAVAKLRKLESNLAQTKTKLASAKDFLDTVVQSKVPGEDSRGLIAELQAKAQEVPAELESMQTKLLDFDKDLKNLKLREARQAEKHNAEIEKLKRDLAAAKSAKNAAEVKIAELTKHNEELQDALDNLNF